jgi:hypothetical protein
MKKLSLLLALVAVTLPAQKVHEEFDASIDFSQYKTYAIRNGRIRSKHPALDNSLVQKKIENALRTQLSAKGLQETSERPDLVVTYVLGAIDRREVDLVPAGWRGLRTRRVAHRYTQGTMVIDLRDARKRELIWRATCTDTGNNPAKIEEHIDKDVKKAFEKYPPKKK